MRRLLLVILLGGAPAFAHGGAPVIQPPPPQPPPDPAPPPPSDPKTPPLPMPPPNGGAKPGSRTPAGPQAPAPTPPPQQPPQRGPTTPSGPNAPTTPKGGSGQTPRRPATRKSRRTGMDQGWRIWWEFNRENLVGFRNVLRGKGTITPSEGPHPDSLAEHRATIRESLLRVAHRASDRMLRASALIALGRLGDPQIARVFLRILRDRREPHDVHESAALGLGMLGPILDPDLRRSVREHLDFFARRDELLGPRGHAFVLMAMGLRAHHDNLLVLRLANRVVAGARSGDEAVSLLFACGLAGDRLLAPELIGATRRLRFAGRRIGEVGRSHAIQAVCRLEDPATAPLFVRLLRSRSARTNSRRSAVLSLGRLLRTGALGRERAHPAGKLLVEVFEGKRDPVLRGFAAVAAGGAQHPTGIYEFEQAIDHGGNAQLKPYAALALGLAARNVDAHRRRRIQTFLSEELGKTRQQSLSSALSIALGLAGADQALDFLLDRIEDRRLGAPERGAAAQAVGLLGRSTPRAAGVLTAALQSGPRPMLGEVALALGMLGRRGTAALLVGMLHRTTSTLHQGRIMLALGHLGSATAVEPLLDVLENRGQRTAAREFAAVALGLLANTREHDALFDIDGDFNYFATTGATNELIRLY